MSITLSLLVVSFLLTALWTDVFVAKRGGEQGVYWSRFFGGTSDSVMGEGTHIKLPWDEIIVYNMRMQLIREKTLLLTRDGMEINIDWSVRFHPISSQLPRLHRELGPEYVKVVVVPETVAALRQIIGNFTAEEVYARDEDSLNAEIQNHVRSQLANFPLRVESVRILRLDLPQDMARSIVEKLIYEQQLLAYRFRLDSEQEEARRKAIEAQGIREFEQISGISILQWKGIEATRELAKSPNSKIILMGTEKNSLPVLLSADKDK